MKIITSLYRNSDPLRRSSDYIILLDATMKENVDENLLRHKNVQTNNKISKQSLHKHVCG